MTLFKRVFNSHTHGTATVQDAPLTNAPRAELTFDEAFVSDTVPEQSAIPISAQSQEEDRVERLVDGPEEDTPEIVMPDTSSVPETEAILTMAERAAQAQSAIAASQMSRAAGQPPDAQSDQAESAPVPESTLAPVQPALFSSDRTSPVATDDVQVATPRPGRGARRVKTRMLGFDPGITAAADPFAKPEPDASAPAQLYPVGWMVVVGGPGTGQAFALFNGVSTIGRGTDQTVPLDFGDTTISREKHAAVAYDDETNGFYLGHGGKSNIVRLNDRPVLSTEDLSHGDIVRIGETRLRFVALCGSDFAWGKPDNADT